MEFAHSEQMKSPSARTVETRINALKTNQYWLAKLATHSEISQSKIYRGQTVVTFSKETFPFATPRSLTGTPFVTGQIIYDRRGNYLGSHIYSGLTGI